MAKSPAAFKFDPLDIDFDSRSGSARVRGSGLKGIIQWSPGPELLAKGVEEAGTRLLNNLGNISQNIAKDMRSDARMLAERQYVNPSSPDRASANLTTARGGTLSRFDVFLYHGPRTQNRGHYYGRNLEAEANQYGGYGHKTEVIVPMITKWGREFMKQCDGALVRGTAGNPGLQRRLQRVGIVE